MGMDHAHDLTQHIHARVSQVTTRCYEILFTALKTMAG